MIVGGSFAPAVQINWNGGLHQRNNGRKMKKIIISPKKGKQGIGAGVWNLGAGRDPFGGPTRPEVPVLERLPLLAEAGITYIEAHDVEIPADDVPEAKKLLKQYGLKVGMYTPSFFADPI